MKRQNYLQGALILMVASLIVKVFGAIFKIPLTNIVDVTSMAYFNTAYGFYVIFYMISTAGVPVAVSKMISEADAKNNKKEIANIFKASLALFIVFGIIGSALMILFSGSYSSFVKLEGLEWAIATISITLFFMCITSAYRGYFQGLKNMSPTAISQVIGAVGKLFIGLLFATIAVKANMPEYMVAAFTLLGITSGSIGSTIYLIIKKKICDKTDYYTVDQISKETSPISQILKRLIIIAIPITLSATILSLTNTIDTTFMVNRLVQSGFEVQEATKIMGSYTSMAVPLNNLSPNLIYPFAVSVIPAISGMFAVGKRDEACKTVSSTFRIAAIISIPCSIGLSLFSAPIISLLYKTDEQILINGKSIAATAVSSELLSILSTSVFFIAMVSVSNAVLQAYGKERLTIISSVTGITAKLILTYILVGLPSVNMFGAPIATVICYAVITIINFIFIVKYTGFLTNILGVVLRPLIASALGIGIPRLIFGMFFTNSSKIYVIAYILLSVILYFVFIFAFRGITVDDIKMLPKGEKIQKILKKFKVLK